MGVDACMVLRVPGEMSEEDVRSLAANAYERYPATLQIWRKEGSFPEEHCIVRVSEYTQDGESIYERLGESLLEVRLSGRYYGEGYERGPLPEYISLAEYFERVIPGVDVLYGGDSSGICAEPFDRAAREKLFHYFVEKGHRPYREIFDTGKDGEACELCQTRMLRTGWGGDYARWTCSGCGTSLEIRDGVRSITGQD